MSLYAQPRVIEDVKDCYFYHTMELPGIGTVKGNWDLRANLNDYLGRIAFQGKRVLDVGCASGILSFYMESRGADVVSFDLDKTGDWDMVPFAKWEDYGHIAHERKSIIDRLNNAYWLAHRLLDSRAKMVYGNVYDIPNAIGPVDISVYGSTLLHFRDPFLALQNGLNLTRSTVVITEVLRGRGARTAKPALGFLPDASTVEPKDTWWDINPKWIMRAVGVLGFEDANVIYHSQKYEGKENKLYTVVARRTHGSVVEAESS